MILSCSGKVGDIISVGCFRASGNWAGITPPVLIGSKSALFKDEDFKLGQHFVYILFS